MLVEDAAPYEALPPADVYNRWDFGRKPLTALGIAAAAVTVLCFSALPSWPATSATPRLEAALQDGPADAVSSLPGLDGPLSSTHYAGHVLVNVTAGNRLFYWFAESKRVADGESASEVPLIMWLNGGPGASSLTGFLVEGIGPYTLDERGVGLKENPWSWHQIGHVLAWDQPAGAGFAFTETPDGHVNSMPQMATELLAGYTPPVPVPYPCPCVPYPCPCTLLAARAAVSAVCA
eukprot:2973415-Prymnesium_polylepis.1